MIEHHLESGGVESMAGRPAVHEVLEASVRQVAEHWLSVSEIRVEIGAQHDGLVGADGPVAAQVDGDALRWDQVARVDV